MIHGGQIIFAYGAFTSHETGLPWSGFKTSDCVRGPRWSGITYLFL